MPTQCVELDQEEMCYVEGGGFWSGLFNGAAAVFGVAAAIAVCVPYGQAIAVTCGICAALCSIAAFICDECDK